MIPVGMGLPEAVTLRLETMKVRFLNIENIYINNPKTENKATENVINKLNDENMNE